MNRIWIGYDPREHNAYRVAHSTIKRNSGPQYIIKALKLKRLGGIINRPVEIRDGKLWCPISQAPMATQFAISRFAVPFLDNKGWCLFVDCDVLCWEDIGNLFAWADPRYAVMCVKHDKAIPFVKCWLECGCETMVRADVAPRSSIRCETHSPPSDTKLFPVVKWEEAPTTKMDNQVQTYYARKNWSSVVLWNCDHEANKRFTVEMLNTLPGRDLHAFCWLEDGEIGELPIKWNWLINVTPGTPEQTGLWHYTCGGPWLKHWKGADYDAEWVAASK